MLGLFIRIDFNLFK